MADGKKIIAALVPKRPDATASQADVLHHVLRDILLEIHNAADRPDEVRRRVAEGLEVLDGETE